jgi:hypothetical protein
MRAAIHWTFAMVLLAVISCSAVHAGAPLPEAPAPACPHHQQELPADQPQHCQDCIQVHFVNESHVAVDSNFVPLCESLPGAIEPATTETQSAELLLAPIEQASPPHSILRI